MPADAAPSPRARARLLARRGCVAFGRLVLVVALVEIVGAIIRAVAEPDTTPAFMIDAGAFVRAVYAIVATVYASRFVPLARALGVRPFALLACTLFALSAAAALLPLFALMPERLNDATWDELLQIVRSVCFVAGTCVLVLVARTIAERDAQPFIARTLIWTTLPLLACLPVAFQAIAPTLLPSPFIGPAIALGLPWAMVGARLMRWDMGMWATFALLALSGTVMFGQTLGSLTLPAVALADVLLLTAIATGGALHELAPSLASDSSDTVSRTLIRNLLGVEAGNAGSRMGDVDPDSSKEPLDDKAEDAEHLARAYRAELGIEAPPPRTGPPPPARSAPSSLPTTAPSPRPAPEPVAPASSPEPAGAAMSTPVAAIAVAPLVPKHQLSRPRVVEHAAGTVAARPSAIAATPLAAAASTAAHAERDDDDDGPPRLAPVLILPAAWTSIDRGLRGCFAAFVMRALVVIFGLMWASSPLGDLWPAVILFDLTLVASSACFVYGLFNLRRTPLPRLRTTATIAFALSLVLLGCDVAAAVVRWLDVDRGLLLAADALVGVLTTVGFLAVVLRLARHLNHDKLRNRARGSLVLLVIWAGLGAATLAARNLPASDLRWLAWPLGFATAAVGLGLWIALLWLTRDAQDALRP